MSLASFLAGAVVGGGLVFGSLSYHVVHTNDGIVWIPKNSPTFLETYLDVRNFGVSDWSRHKGVVAAIVRAKRESIFGDAAVDTAQEGVSNIMGRLGRAPTGG
jgi:hypothetical protein